LDEAERKKFWKVQAMREEGKTGASLSRASAGELQEKNICSRYAVEYVFGLQPMSSAYPAR
jgi:hypothetical protein